LVLFVVTSQIPLYSSDSDEDEVPSDGRIRFKMPTGSGKKREKLEDGDLPESEVAKEKKKKKKDKKAGKSLLSFEEEDGDE
jgi:hypothetical protein